MTNLSIVSRDEVSENQVIRSNVAKTQQPDAERLKFSDSFLSLTFNLVIHITKLINFKGEFLYPFIVCLPDSPKRRKFMFLWRWAWNLTGS